MFECRESPKFLPNGLCPDRDDHEPHPYTSTSLGTFLCTGDWRDREPGRSERRKSEHQQP